MPDPVNPATKTAVSIPRFLGYSAEACIWAKWKVMPPSPRKMEAGMKALGPEDWDTPNRIRPRMLSRLPAEVVMGGSGTSGTDIGCVGNP